jgi:PAS domain S-box-containing protein
VQDTEKRLAALLEYSSEISMIINPDGTIKFISPAVKRILGYTPEEMHAKSMFDYICADYHKTSEEEMHYLLAGADRMITISCKVLHKNGSWRQVECTKRNLLHDPNIKGIVANFHDITEKIETIQRLRASEERFNLAVQATSDAIWDFDIITKKLYLSPQWKAQLGYQEHELPDRFETWSESLHPDDIEYVIKTFEEYLEGRIPEYKLLFRMLHKDASYRWIMCRGIAVRNEEGKAIRFIGSHTDMTEFKRLEESLRNTLKKAEAATIAKMEFLANMSHEIRTPMNAIVGLTYILKDTKPLTAKQQHCLATLQDSADNLLALINDMLDFSKIENNRIEIENVEFNLKELVDKNIGILSVKASHKGLKLSVHYQQGLSHYHLGDPLRIQQILTNLIGNAIKFTEKGEVLLSVMGGAVHANIMEVTFSISDTGIGIAEDMLMSIFDKFTQADTSITRKYGGSGLGLAICKSLIEKMSGTIAVVSTRNEGSVFTFQLPLEQCQPAVTGYGIETVANADSPLPTCKAMVLLVEDYQPNILVATTLLNKFGYCYEVAVNGYEALEKFSSNHYNIILLDIQMQGIDGYETARRIRQKESESQCQPVPIIAMTAYALVGDREKCLDAGMDDYIAKPFNAHELENKLRSFLKNVVSAA